MSTHRAAWKQWGQSGQRADTDRSSWRVAGLVGVLALLACIAGCDGDGGAGGESPPDEVTAPVGVVDLAPGRTEAQLGWEPSRGGVAYYLVFERRNGGSWSPLAQPTAPTVRITGSPGDELQILVLALGPSGSTSPPSPPSPIVRFHADPHAPAAASVVRASRTLAPMIDEPSASEPTFVEQDDEQDTESSDPSDSDSATPGESGPNQPDGQDDGASSRPQPLTPAVRAELLRADPRMPTGGVSPAVAAWLTEQVAIEGLADLRLVGTGHSDPDGRSELVWQNDADGLLVSDGAALSESAPVGSTLDERLAIATTERFLGLADVDGDGRGDWLIEDLETGEVWIVDDATLTARAALDAAGSASGDDARALLVGLGDLDRDGRSELVWQSESGTLSWSRNGDAAPRAFAEDLATDGSMLAGELLLVADFDGDGGDDLLLRGTDGRLVLGHSIVETELGEPALRIQTRFAPELDSSGRDPIAALDLDGDGAAEIAWLVGGEVELWDPRSGALTVHDHSTSE